jgi:predicted small lipoprotein YifL
MNKRSFLLLLGALALLLGGCGNKGPLELPAPEPERAAGR